MPSEHFDLSQSSSQSNIIPPVQGSLPSYFNLSINAEQSTLARRALFELTPSSPSVIIAGAKSACVLELSPHPEQGSYLIRPHNPQSTEISDVPPITLEYCGGYFPLLSGCIVRPGTSLFIDGTRITLPNNFSLSSQVLRDEFPITRGPYERVSLWGDESQFIEGRLLYGNYAAMTDMGVSDFVQINAGTEFSFWKSRGRENNEDSVGIDIHQDGRSLLVVSDGMGGPPAGEIASILVVIALLDLFQQDIPLAQAFALSRNSIHNYVASSGNPKLNKMGAVAVSAEVNEHSVNFHNLGDCRAYVIRVTDSGAEIIHKTTDHTAIRTEIAEGRITEAEAFSMYIENKEEDRRKFYPKKFVCIAPDKGPEISDWVIPTETSCELIKGDLVILASDGLWGTCSEQELCALAALHNNPGALRDALHAAATEKTTKIVQCRDNISIVVYQHGTPGVSAETP